MIIGKPNTHVLSFKSSECANFLGNIKEILIVFWSAPAIKAICHENDDEFLEIWILLYKCKNPLERNEKVVPAMGVKRLDLGFIICLIVTLEFAIDAMMVCHGDELVKWPRSRIEVPLT